MAVIGTFGSFTAARLAIYASQSSLNVTGNNIANINTKGYTRQRMDLVSLHSAGSARYHSGYNLDIGYGVLADSVSQLRDPFLDIRYRNENSSVGSYEARVKGLQQISSILDEVGKGEGEFGVLEAQFNDFMSQLNVLNYAAGTEEFDTTVRSSAESLVKYFNSYAKALNTVQSNQLEQIKDEVKSVNTILTQIRDLNAQIREAGIHHEKALELRDQRNVLIDDLSSYMKIDVRYSMEKIDEFSEVEKLSISLADTGNPPIYLVNGIYGAQISMPEESPMRNPQYDPTDPRGMKYISRESDFGAKPPKIVLTDNEREAYKNPDGSLMLNEAPNNPDPNTCFVPTHIAGMKYAQVDKDGTIIAYTDDPEQASMVDNAKDGSMENRLWMQVQPLVDEKGRYIRDDYGREIKDVVDLGDTTLYGSLQTMRELLTEEGEFASDTDIAFDHEASGKRGIPYYIHALNNLAQQFAAAYNKANQLDFDMVGAAYETGQVPDPDPTAAPGGTVTGFVDKNGDPIKIKVPDPADPTQMIDHTIVPGDFDDATSKLTEEQKYAAMEQLRLNGTLTKDYSFYNGGVLFSSSGDENNPQGITAANITIAKSWATGEVRLLNTKVVDGKDHSTADDNITHLWNLMNEQMDYFAGTTIGDASQGDKRFFHGTFQQRLADINIILSSDHMVSNLQYEDFTSKALNLENSRQSVSGVDLNDEATSMMTFQKSYSAACQLMTTLDSMLDKLINDTMR